VTQDASHFGKLLPQSASVQVSGLARRAESFPHLVLVGLV